MAYISILTERLVKLICYRDAGKLVTSDDACKEQLYTIRDLLKAEGLALVKDPYRIDNVERVLTYQKIWDFSLGYTDSKLEKWLEKHQSVLKRMPRYGAIALIFGIIIYLALPTLGSLVKPVSTWPHEFDTAFSLLSIILSFFGLNIDLPKRIKHLSKKKTGTHQIHSSETGNHEFESGKEEELSM